MVVVFTSFPVLENFRITRCINAKRLVWLPVIKFNPPKISLYEFIEPDPRTIGVFAIH